MNTGDDISRIPTFILERKLEKWQRFLAEDPGQQAYFGNSEVAEEWVYQENRINAELREHINALVKFVSKELHTRKDKPKTKINPNWKFITR